MHATQPIRRGPGLWVVRAAWTLIAAATLSLLIILIPINLRVITSDWEVQESYRVVAPFMRLGTYAQYMLTLRYLVLAAYLGAAGLIAWRRPADGMALLASATLLTLPLGSGLSGDLSSAFYPQPAWWPAARAAGRFLGLASTSYLLPALFFLFPSGRFVPGGLAWIAGVAAIPVTLGLAGLWREADNYWTLWILGLLAALLAALAGQLYRYQRVSNPSERVQTRWVLAALAAVPLSLLLTLLLSQLIGPVSTRTQAQLTFVGLHVQRLISLAIPVSLGLAVLRRGLWGADPILNRALVYGGLSALLFMLYILVVGGLGTLFGQADNALLAVLATGLIAALVNPVRQRIQRTANRLMYGDRDDPATVLSRLGERLETTQSPADALRHLAETVVQALRLPYAAVEVELEGGAPSVVGAGRPPAQPDPAGLRLPIRHGSEVLGHLRAAPRAPGEAFTINDQRLLTDIARQAGAAVYAAQLNTALQRSRERLVLAREEERRRLRRDLHDGLGPTLASQTFALDAALAALAQDPARAQALLESVKAHTQATVADIRRLVQDLRPPALDELGLAGALQEWVRRFDDEARGPFFTVEAPASLPSLPAAVEVAAYRIAAEAVTNVIRHAGAKRGWVRLAITDRPLGLCLEVEDDGHGLPAQAGAGLGLISMRERAQELGGTLTLTARPGGGLCVAAHLPVE